MTSSREVVKKCESHQEEKLDRAIEYAHAVIDELCSVVRQRSSDSKLTVPSMPEEKNGVVLASGAEWSSALKRLLDDGFTTLPIRVFERDHNKDEPGKDSAASREIANMPHDPHDVCGQLECINVELNIADCDCDDLKMLEGIENRYMYSRRYMTDSYANWSFLAEEGDDVATFIQCVREESKVYPRPMKASSLENPPFLMKQSHITEIYNSISKIEEYSDIQVVEASNGDIYYYSSDYLSQKRAKRMAEYISVIRFAKP